MAKQATRQATKQATKQAFQQGARQEALKRVTFFTDLGWIGLTISRRGVRKLTFEHAVETRARAAACAGIHEPIEDVDAEEFAPLVELLRDYAGGRPVDFLGVALDLPPCTVFQASVIAHCRRIPFGETLSYGQLAKRAGSPRAARAVGNIMKSNLIPLLVPCHRVLASGGKIGGYSAPGGLSVKSRLLALESGKAVVLAKIKKPRN